MSEVKIVVYFKKHTRYPGSPAYQGQEYWIFNEKLSQDQIEGGEKGWEIIIDKKHPCFKEIDLRAKWDEDKVEYIGIYELTFDKNTGKQNQIYHIKEWWFDKKDIITIREREREQNQRTTRTNCWIGGYN